MAALAVTEDYMRTTNAKQHRSADLARERTVCFVVHVLSAESHLRALQHLIHGGEVNKWRADEKIDRRMHPSTTNNCAGKLYRGRAIRVHFPIAGDQFAKHASIWDCGFRILD